MSVTKKSENETKFSQTGYASMGNRGTLLASLTYFLLDWLMSR